MKTEYRYGQKIYELRAERGWSQEQLAKIAGINTRTVQRLEAGKTKSWETLKAVAAAFEVDIRDLRRRFWVAEAKPLRSIAIETADDFRVVIHRGHHYGSQRRLDRLDPQIEPSIDELMTAIFSEMPTANPEEPELSWFIDSIRKPVEELRALRL